MNKWLAYIFYSNNRLKLEYKEGQYYLLSRGESVTPDKVSVGERNAIALCYFFLSTMQGRIIQELSRNGDIFVDMKDKMPVFFDNAKNLSSELNKYVRLVVN